MDKRDPGSVTGRGKRFFTWYQRNIICCRDLEQCARNLLLDVFRRELEITQCYLYQSKSSICIKLQLVRFQVLTAVFLCGQVFWHVMPCRWPSDCSSRTACALKHCVGVHSSDNTMSLPGTLESSKGFVLILQYIRDSCNVVCPVVL